MRQPALIYHPQPEGQDLSDRIELVDEWGANLVLGLEHETNAWGDVTVVVYALYEIHNHSGLSLFYGQVLVLLQSDMALSFFFFRPSPRLSDIALLVVSQPDIVVFLLSDIASSV